MKYLVDKIEELPKNSLFNKGMIGCGGTSLAIECDKPYVIAVPYSSLVKNKVKQYPNDRYPHHVFGVLEGVTVADVEEYLKRVAVPKIITTYDSLPKVVEALGESVSQVYLLVDEYHLLFIQYAFREQAIRSVLNLYVLFKSFTFMTATPLEQEYILDELKHLPIVTLQWSEEEMFNVKVLVKKCKNVVSSSIKLIRRFLAGTESGNLYIFVNSLSIIDRLVKCAELTPDNCRLVYSKHNERVVCYKSGGQRIVIPNSTVEDSPKKINLLTSTVFEGCDIFDPEGKTVILSDPFHKNSMLDISTSVNQIAGRIRNSKYIGEMTHLFQESGFRELSIDEYRDHIHDEINRAEKFISHYESIKDESIRQMIRPDNNKYLFKTEDDGAVYFDRNLPMVDLFLYKVQNEYSTTVSLGSEYTSQNSTVEYGSDNAFYIDLYRLNEGAGIDKDFKDLVKEIRESNGPTRAILIKDAELSYPFLGEAIDKLGFQRIESLGYCQKAIKNELLVIGDLSNEEKVFKKLEYVVGNFYSTSTVKIDLQQAYNSLGYNQRTAKSTDIEKYYQVKNHRKRIDGKQVWGYVIMAPKY